MRISDLGSDVCSSDLTAMSPGVTVAPLASIVRTPDGTATFAPAAAMRPARTRTVPFWTSPTGPGVRRCALVIAKVCAATGEAVAARARAMPVKTGSRRCISFRPDRVADFKIASVARGGIARVEDERAVVEDILGDVVDAERIFAPQHDVGHLAIGRASCRERVCQYV